MIDISNMKTSQNEITMAKRLKELGWKYTEQMPSHTVYRDKKHTLIGVTVFQADGINCRHYVL